MAGLPNSPLRRADRKPDLLAMLPAMLRSFLMLPVLGYASWHIYRRAFVHEAI
ncbi:hypothetical protein LSUCC0387_11795 [Rhodobacterales bacterium LSUCC0387]|nr:hypothetical protein [Rhodobacterales bacterium LSUCC0374]MBF9041560.1 hypothetical protein [Rhodobacterales bacterium LSUCC0387]